MQKLTKIIATIGPSSDSLERIEKLILSGVNIFRFNMKHNTPDWHLERIDRVQTIADKLNVHVGIMIDLQGPEIRIETKDEKSIKLKENQEVIGDPPLNRAVELIKSWEIFGGGKNSNADQMM